MYFGLTLKRNPLHSLYQNRILWATGLSILVHLVGLTGMIWVDRQWFSSLTPVNLVLMFFMVIWTQENKNQSFLSFIILAFFTGMVTEIIGVSTGILFGQYTYGTVLGPKLFEVPILIGINWFMVVFTSAATFRLFRNLFASMLGSASKMRSVLSNRLVTALGTAVFATFFDWVMEPVAVKLGFWTWVADAQIPTLNYLTWFFISLFLALCSNLLRISTRNSFSVNLFLIQMMFFIILRFFI
jgi:putative membrane protein